MKIPEWSSLPARFWDKVAPVESGCWEWLASRRGGYGQYSHNGRRQQSHRLAYEDKHSSLGKMYALHRCDNKGCVNPSHLYAGNQKENVGDSIERGSFPYGESNYNSKLTSSDVSWIRLRYASGGVSHRQLAESFGVCRQLIGAIVNRKQWRHT